MAFYVPMCYYETAYSLTGKVTMVMDTLKVLLQINRRCIALTTDMLCNTTASAILRLLSLLWSLYTFAYCSLLLLHEINLCSKSKCVWLLLLVNFPWCDAFLETTNTGNWYPVFTVSKNPDHFDFFGMTSLKQVGYWLSIISENLTHTIFSHNISKTGHSVFGK